MPITRRLLMIGGASLPLMYREAAAQDAGGVFRFGLQGYPASLAPWLHPGTSATTCRLMIHRGLLGYDSDGKLRGELAESWEHLGGTDWKFTLRDAVFHNGAKVTSDDVKWCLETMAAPNSTAYMRALIQQIAKVEAPDPRTVLISTKEPVVTLPLWMASCFLPIVAKGSTDNAQQIGIGAGPFTLTSQSRGTSLEFEAFDKFYRPGLPKLKKAKFIAYPDDNLRVSALQAGDVDAIEFVPWPLMKSISGDSKLHLDNSDNGIFMYLVFNGSVKPFDDPRVRLAIAHAVRREEIVKAVFYDQGATLEGLPLTTASPIYDADSAHAWKYDAAKAKALLAEAGLPNGFSCRLLVATLPMHRDTGQVVQQHLGDIGIQVELVQNDWPTRVTMGDRGQYEMAVGGMALDNNDPDGLSEVLSSRLNPSNLRSYKLVVPGLDDALAAGRAEFDPEKRKALYAKVRDLALANAPLVTLTWRRQSYASSAKVKGFHNMPGALTGYSGTTIEQTFFA